MRVLVTGATSLIGRHTVARLIERGDAVTTLQLSSAGPSNGIAEILGSIADQGTVERACDGQDAIVHL
ncbi:MAG: NAD-dependent epimerase/dehydratase family protein, partial [Acidimicrobiia bacterium]